MDSRTLYERFALQAPAAVMVQGLFDSCFDPAFLDQLAAQHLPADPNPRRVAFSHLVQVLLPVVFRSVSSVRHAYRDDEQLQALATIKCLYSRLAATPIAASAAFVTATAQRVEPLLGDSTSAQTSPYRYLVLDGNHLAATQKRLTVLAGKPAPLPGQALVLRNQSFGLFERVWLCEDGHANERSICQHTLDWFVVNDVVTCDRNFCTELFISALLAKGAFVVVRRHGGVGLRAVHDCPRQACGRTEAGLLFESKVYFAQTDIQLRLVEVELDKPTQDGDKCIEILTNLPASTHDAHAVAGLYSKRWRIENAFQELAGSLRGEIETLGSPRASLLAFALAAGAYNMLACVRATAERVKDASADQAELSPVLLGQEVDRYASGIAIALAGNEYMPSADWTSEQLREWLEGLAKRLIGGRYDKSKRGHRKVRAKGTQTKGNGQHTATDRLLHPERYQGKSQR